MHCQINKAAMIMCERSVEFYSFICFPIFIFFFGVITIIIIVIIVFVVIIV